MVELQRLEWSEIDLNRRFITVAAHKAKNLPSFSNLEYRLNF
jgi:hypothetical protein